MMRQGLSLEKGSLRASASQAYASARRILLSLLVEPEIAIQRAGPAEAGKIAEVVVVQELEAAAKYLHDAHQAHRTGACHPPPAAVAAEIEVLAALAG